MKKIIFFLVISNYQCMFGASCTTLKRSIDELERRVATIQKDVEKVLSSKPGVASSSSSTAKTPPPPPPPPSPKGSAGKKEGSSISEQSPVKFEIKKPEIKSGESTESFQQAMKRQRQAIAPEEFGEVPEEFEED